MSLLEGRLPSLARSTLNKLSVVVDGPASRELRHAGPSQSPWGSAEPLVTFLTFFTFSIAPDVVTLNEKRATRSVSVAQ